MPVSDPRTGRICVWVTSCLFFVSIVTGGAFLAIYVSNTDTEEWFPIAGVSLVGIPWLFWLLTLLYRCISRACGFRVGGPGISSSSHTGVINAGSISLAGGCPAIPSAGGSSNNGGGAPPDSSVETHGSNGRRVRFGEARVVNETQTPAHFTQQQQQQQDDPRNSGSSNSDYDDISSLESRECEIPLAPAISSSIPPQC